MRPIKIFVGPFAAVFDAKRLVVISTSRRDRHFTLFFEPNRIGRNAGKFTPHITTTSGRRHTLASIVPERLIAFFDRIAAEGCARWLSEARRADLHAMAAEGWEVFLASDVEVASWIKKEMAVGDHEYRWTEMSTQRLFEWSVDYFVPVTELDADPRRETRPFVGVRVTPNDVLELCWLGYFPRVGWVRTRHDLFGDGWFSDVIIRHSSPRLWRATLAALDLLGIKGDRDALHAALEKARRSAAADRPSSDMLRADALASFERLMREP